MRQLPTTIISDAETPRCFPRPFLLGGSSINYIKDNADFLGLELTFQYCERSLVEVIAVGGCAYGSHRLLPVVLELLEYQPDMIIFYEGNNEFEELEQLKFVRLCGHYPYSVSSTNRPFARFVRDRMAFIQLSHYQQQRNEQLLRTNPDDDPRRILLVFEQAEIEKRMKTYEENLTLMIDACKSRKVPFVLSTVPSNLFKPDLNNRAEEARIRALYDRGDYAGGAAAAREQLKHSMRHQASDTENSIIRRVAEKNGVPLADVEQRIIDAEPAPCPRRKPFSGIGAISTTPARETDAVCFQRVYRARVVGEEAGKTGTEIARQQTRRRPIARTAPVLIPADRFPAGR